MENRNGLAVAGLVTQASGTAERAAAERMLGKNASPHTRITVGADKAYDVAEHVARLRAKNITPHIAVNAYVTKTGQARKTSIDGRTTRHKGYSLSQGKRKIDGVHVWMGQATWHHAQGEIPGPRWSRRRLPAQSDRRQPHPHPETAGAEGIEVSENAKPFR